MRALFVSAVGFVIAATGLMGADTPAAPNAAAPAHDQLVAVRSMAPTLTVVEAEAGKKPAPAGVIELAKVDINVAIAGPLAETTTTLTFKNTANRILEAELEFPLPEGAAISGYGLDINGFMVDGVPVEKLRARKIFDSEQRKGVDPGILEQTRGNNFKTRVSPVPPNATRMVKIKYISPLIQTIDINGGNLSISRAYSSPLQFGGKIGDANIHIEVAGEAKPSVGGLEGLAFESQNGKMVASKTFHNVELKGTLAVSLPDVKSETVLIERRERQITAEEMAAGDKANDKSRDEYYFMIELPALGHLTKPSALPKKLDRIAIYWDASLSREGSDKSAEIETIKELCKTAGNLTVDLATFSNTRQPAESFVIKAGNADALIKRLQSVIYDGATDLSALTIASTVGELGLPQDEKIGYDCALIFTDGIATLGSGLPAQAKIPLYTVTADVRADFAVLRKIADGAPLGAFFNLQQIKPAAVASTIISAEQNQRTIVTTDQNVADLYPRAAQSPYVTQTLTGRLLAEQASITFKRENATSTITLKKSDAVAGNLVSRHWAGQKIADLSATPDKNADDLLAIGKNFGMVTPNTSLMVLERVEQYLQYHIVPPKSHPELYKQFVERIEKEGAEKKKDEQAKIDRVLAMWKARVEWWEKDFSKAVVVQRADKDKALGSIAGAEPDRVQQAVEGLVRAQREERGSISPIAPGTPPVSTGVPVDPSRAAGGSNNNNSLATAGNQANGVTTIREATPAYEGTPRSAQPAASPRATVTLGGSDGDLSLDGVVTEANGYTYNHRAIAGKQTGASIDRPIAIAIKQYDPKTPYIAALKAAPAANAYAVFIDQRKTFGNSPGFFLDCADFFTKSNQPAIAVRILTDIAELKLESAPLLRIAAYRLLQLGYLDLAIDLFEKAKQLRPDEPQSWRDLAIAHEAHGDMLYNTVTDSDFNAEGRRPAIDEFQKALDCYHHVVMNKWDRFDEIELIALMEDNALWDHIQHLGGYDMVVKFANAKVSNPLDNRLIKNLSCDLRIVMTWDADVTDIDLHVLEPTGEEAFYSHNRTQTGGLVSRDFTQGYGPEEYCIKTARPGKYKISAVYYGSQSQSLAGPVTVQATVITNFGKPTEKREAMTLRLTDKKETVTIGEVEIK